MKEKLEVFEDQLKKIDAPVIRLFCPPIEDESVLIDFIHKHWGNNVIIPSELIEFFKWHNGTDYKKTEEAEIRAGYMADEICFVSLKKIEEIISGQTFVEYLAEKLFPLFISFNGEELAVKLDHTQCLIYCSTSDFEIENTISMYDSLTTFINTQIAFYQNNCLILGPEGTIELGKDKYELFMSIGNEMNPTSDYWRVKREFQEN